MSTLLLHPTTKASLAAMARHMPQGILVSGAKGIGKTYTLQQWLQDTLHASPTQVHIIAPTEKTGISVAQIRELYRSTRNKLTEPRYYILPDAGNMSTGAQNAFLKLLEEPNEHIYFILTVHSVQDVLPTIQSRTQQLYVSPVDDQLLQAHLQKTFTLEPSAVAQILFVATGRPGIASRLASDTALLESERQLAAQAKTFISGDAFERLTVVQQLANDRDKAIKLLELAATMTDRLLLRSKPADQPRLVQQLRLLHDTLERLSMNANVKLQLTRSALHASPQKVV